MQPRKLIADILGRNSEDLLNIENFEEIDGWDSLAYLKLIIKIEQDFGVQLTPSQLKSIVDLCSLQKLLDQLSQE